MYIIFIIFMYFSCTDKKSTKRSSRHELRSHENINCSTQDKQTRGINTPQTMLVFVVVSQIFSAHSITVSKVLCLCALHSKSLAPRTSFSERKVRVYPQHPFNPATAGCSEQQPVFFSFGCVFFSLHC